MNQILYEGRIFLPNLRVDMQVGVGLHMSHARQKLEILGGFKTPIFSKNGFLGEKKGISAPKLQSEGDFFFIILEGPHTQDLGPI